MIKITTKKELEKKCMEGLELNGIYSSILGDLYTIDEMNKANSLNSYVMLMDCDEFEKLEKIDFNIEKDEYEEKTIVNVQRDGYVIRVVYIADNGNVGVVIYVRHQFGELYKAFGDRRLITKRVAAELPGSVVRYIYDIVEEARIATMGKLDYLQVFEIYPAGSNVYKILHKQELPAYTREYYVALTTGDKLPGSRLFLISEDDENGKEYSVLMFAEEY